MHSKQGIARAGRANLGLIRSTKTVDFGNLQYRIITEGEIEAFRTFADLLDSADSTPRDDYDNETNSFLLLCFHEVDVLSLFRLCLHFFYIHKHCQPCLLKFR